MTEAQGQQANALDTPGRDQIARRTAVLGLVYQAVYAGSQLLATGVISRAVGAEEFGLWLTVFALTTWVPVLALGQYAVLLTRLGAVARRDPAAATQAYSASFAVASAVAGTVLLAVLATAPWAPWHAWLNASAPALAAMAGPVAVAALATSLLAVPVTLMGYAVFAHQRGDLVHVAMIGGSIASTLALLLAASAGEPLWVLGVAAVAGPLLGGCWIAWRHAGGPHLPRLSLAALRWTHAQHALKLGVSLAAADLLLFAVVRTPELVVARLHGLDAVASFGAVGRLPVLLLAVFQALMLPYWPALAEAVKLGDLAWVRRSAWKGLATTLGIWLVVTVVLLGFGQPLFKVWLGNTVVIPQPYIVAACGQSLGIGLLAWLMVLLNAQSRTGTLLVTLGVVAVVYVGCGVWLGLQHGPVGVAIGQVIGLCGVVIPTAAWQLRSLMRALPAPGAAPAQRP